jgi:hypothetical protein
MCKRLYTGSKRHCVPRLICVIVARGEEAVAEDEALSKDSVEKIDHRE